VVVTHMKIRGGCKLGGRGGFLVGKMWNAPFIYYAYDFCPCLNSGMTNPSGHLLHYD